MLPIKQSQLPLLLPSLAPLSEWLGSRPAGRPLSSPPTSSMHAYTSISTPRSQSSISGRVSRLRCAISVKQLLGMNLRTLRPIHDISAFS